MLPIPPWLCLVWPSIHRQHCPVMGSPGRVVLGARDIKDRGRVPADVVAKYEAAAGR